MKEYSNPKLSPAAAMIIFVCVIVIFTISLLYISKRPPNTEPLEKPEAVNIENKPAQPENIETTSPSEPLKTSYSNPKYNFSLDFSEGYTSSVLNTDNGARIDFALADWKATMLIDIVSNINLIRNSYEIGQEDDITINNLPATRIIGSSLKDASVTYIYLIAIDDRLFAFYSTSANIQSIAKTLTFSK